MAVTVVEQTTQNYKRNEGGFQFVRNFWVDGVVDAIEAATATDAVTALTIPAYGSQYLTTGLFVDNIDSKQKEDTGDADGHAFEVTVNYSLKFQDGGKPTNPQDGDEWWTFRSNQARVNQKYCKAQVPYASKPPDIKLLVGGDDENNLEGADVLTFTGELEVHLWKTTADVNAAYLAGIIDEFAKTNSALWYGFAIGEALFAGFERVGETENVTELKFTFLISPNFAAGDLPTFTDWNGGAGFTIAGGKTGHEYLWVISKPDVGDNRQARVAGAYVARFYDASDYAALDLSGSL